jgi:hypothetical protein
MTKQNKRQWYIIKCRKMGIMILQGRKKTGDCETRWIARSYDDLILEKKGYTHTYI